MTNMFNKSARFWVYSIILAIGSVLLFLGGPDYYSSRSFKYLWDIGHIVYFALLTCLLLRWRFVAQMSLAGQWTIILVITLLVGVSIEFLQYGTDRIPDTGDVLRDLTGSLLVLVFGSSKSASQHVSWQLSKQLSSSFSLPIFPRWHRLGVMPQATLCLTGFDLRH